MCHFVNKYATYLLTAMQLEIANKVAFWIHTDSGFLSSGIENPKIS